MSDLTVKPEDAGDAIPLLDVRDLTVEFATRRGIVRAVQHVNISLAKGETLGIVGESGSGKSVTSYAVMRILDRAGNIAEGSVMFSGLDLRKAEEAEMRDLRGREISMIFQSPRLALNPIRKIGRQIEDVLQQHAQVDSAAVTEKAVEVLEQVRIARPRDAHLFQHLDRLLGHRGAVDLGMLQQHVLDLAADLADRVERQPRRLKNHRY